MVNESRPTPAASLKALSQRLVRAEGETHLCRLLAQAADAVGSDDLAAALRYADRAARLAPSEPEITLLNGRLLLASGEAALALEALSRAARMSPDSEPAAWQVMAQLALGDRRAARDCLHAALQRFPVFESSTLSAVAHRATVKNRIDAPGWAGFAPNLEIVGEVCLRDSAAEVVVRTEDGRLILSCLPSASRDGVASFRLELPRPLFQGSLSIEFGGAALMGSGLISPPNFALDGRATIEGDSVIGWARLNWMQQPPDQVTIEDRRGGRATVRTTVDPSDPTTGRFVLDLATTGLTGDRYVVAATLPDGRSERLPDTPMLRQPGQIPKGVRRRRGQRSIPQRAPVVVIVPVYAGRSETLACLEAVRATTADMASVIVIDDASPDRALSEALSELAVAGAITLLRNETNQGFPASVNRALALHPGSDAVLLNADALPFDDWLPRLQAAAYSGPNIGTVTPLSNVGSIASYPGDEDVELSQAEAAAIDRAAAALNSDCLAPLPTGVGFCLYLRHDCLAETGPLDAVTFATGYGEENDFCLRAARCGWSHMLAANVYVWHLGGRSFGPRSAALRERNLRLLTRRHPGYEALVEAFVAADPVRALRRRLDEARLAADDGDVVLIVTLHLPGGVERLVRERCAQWRERGVRPLLLQPDPARRAIRCTLAEEPDLYRDLRYELPDEIVEFRTLLARLNLAAIELHHFLDHDAAAIEAVLAAGVEYDAYVHDYSWLCPRLSMLGGDGRFCGEPEIAVCEDCVRVHGASVAEPATVAALRHRSAAWLRSARAVIAPSDDTAKRIQRYFPELHVRVGSWESKIKTARPAPRGATRPVRVALLGAIGTQKGYEVLLACARDAKRRALPINFTVIGYTEDDDPLFELGNVFVTGRYEEDEVEHLLRREAPHVALFASVTPETWCYALSHALRAGIPVVAFELGAIAERLRSAGHGRVVPLNTDASSLNDAILEVAEEASAAPDGMAPLPEPKEQVAARSSDGDNTLSAAAQPITVAPGLYLFRVRAGAAREASASGDIALPAVNLSVAPGGPAGNVEFMSAPGGTGGWLCQSSDMVVARVAHRPATLLLTSLRAPDGPLLSIEVERLNSNSPATSLAAAAGDATGSIGAEPAPAEPEEPSGLRMGLAVHIQRRGNREFTTPAWAGFRGERLWIECFSVTPLEGIGADEIEYKGLVATGYETPWLSKGMPCGTQGKSMPLLGFAVRLKRQANGRYYDCEYSGAFLSGAVVGPCRNGAPCVSTHPDDPVEAIQLRIVEQVDGVRAASAALAVPRAPRPPRHPKGGCKLPTVAPASTDHPKALALV